MSGKIVESRRILMCAPEFFEVLYEINPWMHLDDQPQIDKAKAQWQQLTDNLTKAGAALEFISPAKGLPDMVYTANGGLIYGNTAIVSTFKVAERRGEEVHFERWFDTHGFAIARARKGAFEGEGDALFGGKVLYYGTAAEEVASLVAADDLVVCEMVDPYFYHVDTCLCPLGAQLGFFHRTAFTKDTVKRLEKHLELFCVPEAEAKRFVCNAVVIGKSVVLPANCPETYTWLTSKGFTVYPTELGEFLRGGGSAKCLTLFLDHVAK
jgi:N-dimethylarginine dimethylaminohydrolase